MIDDIIPQSPEDCLVDCAHLFPDRETENSYGNIHYRIALTRIEMLIVQREHEAANKALEEGTKAFEKHLVTVMRNIVDPLGQITL